MKKLNKQKEKINTQKTPKKSRQITKQQVHNREIGIAMAILIFTAIWIVIPLMYMVTGSLSSKQVIRTIPSSLVPFEGKQVKIDELGVPNKKYFVYNIEVNGEKREMAYVAKEGQLWVYVDPDNTSDRVLLPPASPDDRVKTVVFNWSNYKEALTKSPFPSYIRNTLFILILASFGTLLSTLLVAYGFSRFAFKGRNVLFMILLSTMMLPPQVSLIPSFIMYQKLGWYNTYLPLIVPAFFAVSAWNVFLMRQFIMGLPVELDEAARIDGCGPLRTLFSIIVPQAVPVIITIGLFTAVFWWNEFYYSLIYLQDKVKFTVALGLQSFDSLYFNNSALKAAATVMMMTPPILMFFFFQRYFIQGTVVSGVKG